MMKLKVFFVTMICLLFSPSTWAMEEDENCEKPHITKEMRREKSPITEKMVEAAKQNYRKVLNRTALKPGEGTFHNPFVTLIQTHHVFPSIPITVINSCSDNTGHIHIFVTHNTGIIDQELYWSGSSNAVRDDMHATSVTYNIQSLIWPSDVLHCSVTNVHTDQGHRHNGFATVGIKKVVEFVFSCTKVDYISTSVSQDRPYSARAFEKNGFVKVEGNEIHLDETKSFTPRCYFGMEGNYYLTRKTWLKTNPEATE